MIPEAKLRHFAGAISSPTLRNMGNRSPVAAPSSNTETSAKGNVNATERSRSRAQNKQTRRRMLLPARSVPGSGYR